MESVFCFEVAVDKLKLRKRVNCGLPYLAVAFLDFPTILIHLNHTNSSPNNVYLFEKGKSCLFKMSPTELYERLISTRVYVIILDQLADEQTCIGSSSMDLSSTIKDIIGDMQTNGLHRTTCHGASETVNITNFLDDTVGHLEVSYKLTSLGHSMLPHLQVVSIDKNPEKPIVYSSQRKENMLSAIENVVCPPALFYTSTNETKQKTHIENPRCQESAVHMEKKTDKILQSSQKNRKQRNKTCETANNFQKDSAAVKENTFISVQSTAPQICEATQTEAKSMNQYPLLKALVEEVLQLGISKPASAEAPTDLQNVQNQTRTISKRSKPQSAEQAETRHINRSKGSLQHTNHGPPTRKPLRYPLKYGLTKSLILRMEMNQKVPQQHELKIHTHKPRKKVNKKVVRSKKPQPLLKKTTYKKPVLLESDHSLSESDQDDRVSELLISEPYTSDRLTIYDSRQPTVNDFATSPNAGSPRALSRQSIEIRLPTATSSFNDNDVDDDSDKYKYSDDFDQVSLDRSASVLTTLETSPQNTGVDASVDVTANDMQPKLSLELSPEPTTSDISPSPTFGLTYQKTSPSALLQLSPKAYSPGSDEKMSSEISVGFISPKTDAAEDSKYTDNSSSVATTLITAQLPVPPPSDSPVIRSLVSEPTSRSKKPHPPVISHSSSYERIRRKFRKSSESSFHLSGLSDLRTSDLADIKTSDISELRSSDEGFTTNVATTRFLPSKGGGFM